MKSKMGLDSILGSAFTPKAGGNGSESANPYANISPSTLLETFIPGYGPIQKFLLFTFGFDVTILVSLGAILWISSRAGRSLWAIAYGVLSNNYMAEISVNSTDEIHSHLIHFLAQQSKIKSSRRLMAETPSKSAWELDSEDTDTPESSVDSEGNIKWLNFSNQEAKSQPRFTPAIGSHNFWFNGTYFQLKRKEVSLFDEMGSGGGAFKDKEVLTLSCFGRSTEPIKRLIQHAKGHYHLGHNAKTIIKRPAPKDMRRFGGRGSWLKIAERPCRPLNTVVLDDESKMDVLADINEYLSPATARWYSIRGVPYRRGYLFHGPPGTGKTSLTFALAGVFGLDIHVVSLLEPTLTEEELGMLFTNLPARCIVLLEDIDTAGLIRNEAADEEKPQRGPRGGKGSRGQDIDEDNSSLNVVNLTRALKKANEESAEAKKGISLSGLLNIIDGVASHEGRVLIMTTNHPEKLDEALIRPGRVDHQVAFSNASKTQIQELFIRMYTNDFPKTKLLISSSPSSPTTSNSTIEKLPFKSNADIMPQSIPLSPAVRSSNEKAEEVQGEELKVIACDFAREVPDGLFSPAEIQGFLLKRKKDPRKAAREVGVWVKGMVEQKEAKTKVMKVQ